MIGGKIVIVATSYWLRPSQTFIAHHVESLKTWQPCVLALMARPEHYRPEIDITGIGYGRWSPSTMLFCITGRSSAATALINRVAPKLVHVHFLTVAAAMLPFLKRSDLPFIVTAHGYDATMTRFSNPFNEWTMRMRLKQVFARAQRIVCVSDYIREQVIARGCPPEKAVTCYLGIPIPELRPSTRDPSTVLFVGRLVPKKGILTLLEAASMIQDSGTEIRLRVVGDGPQRQDAERLARQRKLHVSWLGAQPHARVLDEMARAALFCMPSSRAPSGDNEGLPIASLEAQALQTPIVAFNQGPMSEAVENQRTGLLAADGQSHALAEHISAILRDPALGEQLGKEGRRRVIERFDICKQSRQLEGLYNAVS